MNLSIESIEGLEGVIAEIKLLTDDRMKRREIIKILKRQVKPILEAVKANTPIADKPIMGRDGKVYEPENLKKSFAIWASPHKQYVNVLIGPKKGYRAKYDGFYAFFVEEGAGNIPATHFIRNASEPFMASVSTTMSAELERYIYKKAQTLNL
jgi:HK97 gp10 family phage protein